MTDNLRMPVVGERYKHKDSQSVCEIKEIRVKFGMNFMSHQEKVEDFFKYFETIPQDPISQPSIPVKEERLPEVGNYYKCILGYYEGEIYFLESRDKIKFALSDYPRSKYYFHDAIGEEINAENFWHYFEEIPNDSQKPSEEEKKSEEERFATDINDGTKAKTAGNAGGKVPEIWKDVSELPEISAFHHQLLLKTSIYESVIIANYNYYGENYIEPQFQNYEGMIEKNKIKKWCYLNDFIDHIELLTESHESEKQKRIELEQRADKLETALLLLAGDDYKPTQSLIKQILGGK